MPDREFATATATPTNALVTGPPRSGKTTALERTVSRLRDRGLAVGGLVSPEIRESDADEEASRRVGFEIAALSTDRRATMAHVDRETGPHVGKYRVDVAAVGRVAGAALERARGEADCIVIDEIAPMQLESERFVVETRRALESSVPVLAAVKADATNGFLGEVKSRPDVATYEVDPSTRDELPGRLVEWVLARR
ncbi:nucleoside-triphosphatase [Halopiger thermotolerans]